MSKKIDSLMNTIARCRADIVADRMMIEALLCTHPDPQTAKDIWKQLHGAHLRDRARLDEADNFQRAVQAEQDEAFSVWRVKLSLAVAQRHT